MRYRRWRLVAATMLLVAATSSPSALSQNLLADSELYALPKEGMIMQGGKVVAWASGVKFDDAKAIRFQKISQAYNFLQSRSFEYAGYNFMVVRVYRVTYRNGDPALGVDLEQVMAEIKGKAAQ